LADIFREVEEDLRRDKLEVLWEKYGILVIGGAVGFVLLIAGTMFWRNYQAEKQARLSDEFAAATELLQTAKTEEAIAAYGAIAGTTGSGYKALSLMQQAAALTNQGKIQEAVVVYDDLIASGAGGAMLTDLAKIKAAWALVETVDAADIKARIGDIASSEKSWRHSAREVMAYSTLRSGDIDAARFGYAELANDRETPQGIAERAAIMLTVIGPAPVATPAVEPEVSPAEPVEAGAETAAEEAPATQPTKPEVASEEPATD